MITSSSQTSSNQRWLDCLYIDDRFNIHDIDAYSMSPDELVHERKHAPGTEKQDGKKGHWYFFTLVRRHETKNDSGWKRQRSGGEGYWLDRHPHYREHGN
jgi:hypothetical protein